MIPIGQDTEQRHGGFQSGQLTIVAFGALRRYLGNASTLAVSLGRGRTVLEVLQQLGIPRGEVGVIAVRGAQVEDCYTPEDGDQLHIYGLVDGG